MLDKFKRENLTQIKKKNILIAVSGGIDSMVLLHLCLHCEFSKIGVIYINHHTRQGMSAQDGKLVEAFCRRNEIPYYQQNYQHRTGNFQEEARNFRYKAFYKIAQRHHYHLIATAHHQDDVIESYLMSIFRGSGSGHTLGIHRQTDQIIRPILSFHKEEISRYAIKNDLPYVDDSSNADNRYTRNFIRHQVLPQLQDKFPNIRKRLQQSLSQHNIDQSLLEFLVNQKRSQILQVTSFGWEIALGEVKDYPYAAHFLHRLLIPFGFTLQQIGESIVTIIATFDSFEQIGVGF